MNTNVALERCLTFINCQIQPGTTQQRAQPQRTDWSAVTISRQAGSGAHVIAERLAQLFQKETSAIARPWTVFDRNLVEAVLEDHHLPKRLARFMPEDRVSEMKDAIDELLGLHPPSWTLVRQTSETILRLADLGNVILIGRGATVVTQHLHHVFHVRLVGSLERRTERVRLAQRISAQKARQTILEEDRGRARYVKTHFGKDVADPLLYHLVINTDWMESETASALIHSAVTNQAAGAQA